MKFFETPVQGAFLIDLQPIEDSRGFFARAWSEPDFEGQGLVTQFVQWNISFNHRRGTLRGMHFQKAPHAEVKLVRCIRGSIFDVLVDLRQDSPTYRQWYGAELSADNRKALYIPRGCAHGYQTLEDNCEVMYQVSDLYAPQAEGGAMWNDPSIGIRWPLPVEVISEKDQRWPPLE